MASIFDTIGRSIGINPDDPSTDPFIRLLMTGSQNAPGQLDRGGLESLFWGQSAADNYDIPRHLVRWSDTLGQASQQRVSQLGGTYGRVLDALGMNAMDDTQRADIIRGMMKNPNFASALGPVVAPFLMTSLAPEVARQKGPMGSYDYVMEELAKSDAPLQRETYDLLTSMIADPLTYAAGIGGARNVALGGAKTAAKGFIPNAGKIVGALLNTGGDTAIEGAIRGGVRKAFSSPATTNEILTEFANIAQAPAAYIPAVLAGRGLGKGLSLAGERFAAPVIKTGVEHTPQPIKDTTETLYKTLTRPFKWLMERTPEAVAEIKTEAVSDVVRPLTRPGDTLAQILEKVQRAAADDPNILPDANQIIQNLALDAKANPNAPAKSIGLTTGVNFSGGALRTGDYALPWTDDAEYLADMEIALRTVPRGMVDVGAMRKGYAGRNLAEIRRVSSGTEVQPDLVSLGNLDITRRAIQLQPMEVVVDPTTGERQFKIPEAKGAWAEVWKKLPGTTQLTFRPGDLVDTPLARRFMTDVVLRHELDAYADARLMGDKAAKSLLSRPVIGGGTRFEQVMTKSGTVEPRFVELAPKEIQASWDDFNKQIVAAPNNPYAPQEVFDRWLLEPRVQVVETQKDNSVMAALGATNPPVGGRVVRHLNLVAVNNGNSWTYAPTMRIEFDHDNPERATVALAALATREGFKDSKFYMGTQIPDAVVPTLQQTSKDMYFKGRSQIAGVGNMLDANEQAALRQAVLAGGNKSWRIIQEDGNTFVEVMTKAPAKISDTTAYTKMMQDKINSVVVNTNLVPMTFDHAFYRVGEINATTIRGPKGVYGIGAGKEGAGNEAGDQWLKATTANTDELYDAHTGWRPITESADINANIDRTAIPSLGQPTGPLDRTLIAGIPRDAQPIYASAGIKQVLVTNMPVFNKAAESTTSTVDIFDKLTLRPDGSRRTLDEALTDPDAGIKAMATKFVARYGTQIDLTNTAQVLDLLMNKVRDEFMGPQAASHIPPQVKATYSLGGMFLREKMMQTLPFVSRNLLGGGLASVMHGFNPYPLDVLMRPIKDIVAGIDPFTGDNTFTRTLSALEISMPPTELRRESGIEGVYGQSKSASESIDPVARAALFSLAHAATGLATGDLPGALVGGAVGAVAGIIDPKIVGIIRRLTQQVERILRTSAWIHGMRTHLVGALPAFINTLPVSEDVKNTIRATDGMFGPTRLVGTLMQDSGLSFEDATRYGSAWQDIREQGSLVGVKLARHINFNYMDRRNVDNMLGILMPFVVWPTRSILFWMQHSDETPALLRVVGSLAETTRRERVQGGLPQRFEGTSTVQSPFSAEFNKTLYGQPGKVRANLISPIFTPLGQFRMGSYMDEDLPPLGRVLETGRQLGINPWPQLDIPLQVGGAYGTKEFMDMFPYSSLVRSLSIAAGTPFEPEPMKYVFTSLRDALVGKPVSVSGSALKDYTINKELINMSIEETGVPDDSAYTHAMTNPASPLYQAAARRVNALNIGQQLQRLSPNPFPTRFLSDTEAVVRKQIKEQSTDVAAERGNVPTTKVDGRAVPTRESKATYTKYLQENPLAVAYSRAGDSPQAQKLQDELDEYSAVGGPSGSELYSLVGKIRATNPTAYEALSPRIKKFYADVGVAKRAYKEAHPLVTSYLDWSNQKAASETLAGPETPSPKISIASYLESQGVPASAGDVSKAPAATPALTAQLALLQSVQKEMADKNIYTLKASNLKYLSPQTRSYLAWKSRSSGQPDSVWAATYQSRSPQ